MAVVVEEQPPPPPAVLIVDPLPLLSVPVAWNVSFFRFYLICYVKN